MKRSKKQRRDRRRRKLWKRVQRHPSYKNPEWLIDRHGLIGKSRARLIKAGYWCNRHSRPLPLCKKKCSKSKSPAMLPGIVGSTPKGNAK